MKHLIHTCSFQTVRSRYPLIQVILLLDRAGLLNTPEPTWYSREFLPSIDENPQGSPVMFSESMAFEPLDVPAGSRSPFFGPMGSIADALFSASKNGIWSLEICRATVPQIDQERLVYVGETDRSYMAPDHVDLALVISGGSRFAIYVDSPLKLNEIERVLVAARCFDSVENKSPYEEFELPSVKRNLLGRIA